MIILTKFSNGDIVYVLRLQHRPKNWHVIGPMTIGQVRVEITDSKGIEDEDVFDNYMPQKWEREQYMCVETGIGSGILYSSGELFNKKEDA